MTALFVSGLSLLASVEAKSSTGSRVLVLLDSLTERDSYTLFWQQLQGKNISWSRKIILLTIT